MSTFKYLFTPIKIGNTTIKNRILSTGHMTTFVKDGLPTEQMVAYHRERAKGGAGLLVLEANAVHPTAIYTAFTLLAYNDHIIPYYRKLADAVHEYGTKMFVQLFHPGREIWPSGSSLAVSASAVPTDRYRVMPKELEIEEIQEIIKGYGDTAERVKKGGLDGVEIVTSHGYLISQFWSPRTNLRTDQYGGSLENRMRFLKEVVEEVRNRVGDEFVVGMRIDSDSLNKEGSTLDEIIGILKYIEDEIGNVDFFNVTGGSASTLSSATFIVPPAPVPPAHFAPHAGKIREKVSTPVFVGSRINDPLIGEKVLANGQADMVGMTRAMICDPHMPNKALREELERIRVCIGCNQACIGHMNNNLPISCIQNPVTGRELEYATLKRSAKRKHILIIGGGPAGMKAAVVATERGHKVTLIEKSDELGGQVKIARKLPGRDEFGELIPNLKRELEYNRVNVQLSTEATLELVQANQPDEIIVATGAMPYYPDIPGVDLPHVATSWEIMEYGKTPGKNVVVADWKGDIEGIGLALYLKEQGCEVELVTQCYQVGFSMQQYLRDTFITKLHLNNIKMTPMYKISNIESSSVAFENVYTGKEMIRNNVDTLVLANGNIQQTELYYQLKSHFPNIHRVGDCLLPRTVEEAVLEGFELAASI